MQVDSSIFKAYDIRGVYGQNLFDETASSIGKAIVKILSPKTIIIGRDCRTSGLALHKALVTSLLNYGVNVTDIGMVSTDMYYFACATRKLPGIMITASHNPKEYNGFKIVRQIPYLLSGEDGIQDILRIIETDNFPPLNATKGILDAWDVMGEYIIKLSQLVDLKSISSLKIVADTANGMVGPSLTKLIAKIPQISLIPMYFEPDGNFPNHGGDPLQAENRAELENRVVAEHADLGVAFDPDGDRFFCIDKKGRFVPGDFMTALFAKYFLAKKPGASIVYDLRASNAVPNFIRAGDGTPLPNKVGHAFIKKRMIDEKAIFGGEVTGHYYFADFYYCDSGLSPMLYLLDMLAHSTTSLDQIVDQLSTQYFISGELNTKNVDSQKVFILLEQKYHEKTNQILHEDGLSMDFGDWHFNVRASNTEPLVRLNLEATTKELMETKRDEVLNLIRS